MAQHIRVKIGYRKSGDQVHFTILYRFNNEPLSGRLVYLGSSFCAGHSWREGLYQLDEFAPFVAEMNGRKNVSSTEADEGVLI